MATWTEDFSGGVPSFENSVGVAEPGTPSISSGRLQFVAASANQYYAAYFTDSEESANFELSFDLEVYSSQTVDNIAGWVFYRHPPTPANANYTTANYALIVFRGGTVQLLKNGTVLGNSSVTAGTNNSYELVVTGDSHKVYINTSLVIDVTDSTYNTASKIGIGNYSDISAFGRGCLFDNFTQTTLAATNTATLSVDAVLQDTISATVSINAVLVIANDTSIDIDAYIISAVFLDVFYLNKDQNNFCQFAQYITDVQDLESNKWKHIKSITAIGDYGDNTIKLAWTKYPDYDNWSDYYEKTPTDPSVVQATRWYNMGQAKRFAFDVQWSGDSNIEHHSLEVRYNLRTK
jgi:hypothetical protein